MKTINKCPCTKHNEDYPYEGFSTKHKYILKPAMKSIYDKETNKDCRLFLHIKSNSGLRKFIQGWIELNKKTQINTIWSGNYNECPK